MRLTLHHSRILFKPKDAVANEQLRQAVMANSIENFEPVFNKQLENLFIERMDGNEEIFVRLMNDEAFRNVAASHLMRAVYQQIRAAYLVTGSCVCSPQLTN